MVHHSCASFMSAVDSGAWETIPCTYLICEQDQGVYPWLQEKMIEDVREESSHKWNVERCNSSHSAWLTHASTMVRLIRNISGEIVS